MPRKSATNTGKEYERIVAEIFEQFADGGEVVRDEKIIGRSGKPRQVDVAIHTTYLGVPILIVVECRDYKRRLEVGAVDGLVGKLDDLGAQIGFLVSNSGYSDAAFARAKQDGRIHLKSVYDVENHKLRVVPALACVFEVIKYTATYEMKTEDGERRYFSDDVPGESGRILHAVLAAESVEAKPGVQTVKVGLRGTDDLPLNVEFTIYVASYYYFKRLRLDGRGIINHESEDTVTIRTKGFATESIDLWEFEQLWDEIPPQDIPRHQIAIQRVKIVASEQEADEVKQRASAWKDDPSVGIPNMPRVTFSRWTELSIAQGQE